MSLPAELICTICTDRAEGYHFGAISCAACGAFFRRSVSDQKTYSCASRTCLVVYGKDRTETKRGGSCRYCRFLKCVRNGMLPADVQAKRQSTNHQPFLYRTLQEETVKFIDELVSIRRKMQVSRSREEMVLNGIQAVVQSVSIEYNLLSEIWSQYPLLQQIIPTPNTSINEPSIFRDILSTYFIFETCITTSGHGGVQLDRLIFPNFTFIELSSRDFCQVFGSGDMSRVCSFLVQSLARCNQSAHFDETYQAVLFYTVLVQSVPQAHRNPETFEIWKRMIAGLGQVDNKFNSKLDGIVQHIHHGTHIFKQILFPSY